jgi:general secretion pathway protein G
MLAIKQSTTWSAGRQRGVGHKAFTLVEILIVIIVLGILAAIAIPQFSNASQQSRVNSLVAQLKQMRGQVVLFRAQHGDILPNLVTNQWSQFLQKTNDLGAVDTTAMGIWGPYVNKMPMNPLNQNTTVAASAGAGVGWVYDVTTGDLKATNQTSTLVFDENTQTVQ